MYITDEKRNFLKEAWRHSRIMAITIRSTAKRKGYWRRSRDNRM
jgi:hypothetical protein